MGGKVLAACAVTFIVCLLLTRATPHDDEPSPWLAWLALMLIASSFIGFCDLIYLIWEGK